MQKEAFGKLLIILRKKNGLSQKELAERLSISTSAVSKWENGKNLPDMMMLSHIADILQVSCDELHNPEKTLEKLDNPEFQKRNVEEEDKENTDNTGENEESEPEPQKKNYGRIVRMSFLIGILAIVAGMFLIYMVGHRKTAFQQVGTRYIDDPSWGMVYEIAVVVNTKIDYELMSTYMEEVKNQMNEKQDLETIKEFTSHNLPCESFKENLSEHRRIILNAKELLFQLYGLKEGETNETT